jgi:hypothetical protein
MTIAGTDSIAIPAGCLTLYNGEWVKVTWTSQMGWNSLQLTQQTDGNLVLTDSSSGTPVSGTISTIGPTAVVLGHHVRGQLRGARLPGAVHLERRSGRRQLRRPHDLGLRHAGRRQRAPRLPDQQRPPHDLPVLGRRGAVGQLDLSLARPAL